MGVGRLTAGLLAAAALAGAGPSAAHAADVWEPVKGQLSSARAEVKPERYKAFTLDTAGLKMNLTRAAKQRSATSTVLELPAPDGKLQRFAVHESSIMEAGLAARHPEIKTYAGRGLDDLTASVVADMSPLGLHASVRSASGAWYVDPYYKGDDGVYVSYFTRHLEEDAAERFVEEEPVGQAKASSFTESAVLGPEVQLRTYRLALTTDPSYATYFGAEHVTAAKVTLMNRVNQIYETESAIRMILIADTDKLNLNTVATATGPNGPCGAAPCFTATNSCGAVLDRNRIVIGQIVGAANYDVGHIAMGNSGGGVAGLGVVGGDQKARGCTGLATPIGDYFAVDYVAHELGHQFAGNHTFNGTQGNCGGNRSGLNSVEPGSGSSIMAYAGICQQDNLQAHTDPYWAPRSYHEILAHVTREPLAVNEVQTISLRDFGGTDSVTLGFGENTLGPFVGGTNFSAADIQGTLTGQEAQTVRLAGYDANGDAYRLSYKGVASVPIVRGQNNTAAGILAALAGGNEQQQVTLTGFNATTASYAIQINGVTSATIGQGGLANTNANIAAAINGIAGFAGGATVTGAGNGGFTVTFAGASAGTDVPAISIVNCTCAATVRETVKGGPALTSWPAGATVTVGPVTDAGYTLLFGGTLARTDVDTVVATDAAGVEATVVETTKGGAGVLPTGATATVAGFGGGTFDGTGFQVTFAGTLANTDLPPLGLTVEGGTGFVGETARGGPGTNRGLTVTPTGNHAPDVTVPAAMTIPPRTPFALTGSATDPDGDVVTYMWEQNDRAGIEGVTTAGTALVNQTKTNGAIFRQFGVAADIPLADSLKYHSPGLNLVTTHPTRTFPDMGQVLTDNTNARTGRCEVPVPAAPAALPFATRECFSEWLPTADWVGFLSDRTLTFRLTARDGRAGGGGIGYAETKVTVAQFAGPFRVTSHAVPQNVYGLSPQRITWDVAGTDVAPVNTSAVKISLSTDGGLTFGHVLAESTPNDGSADVVIPEVTAERARIKVEAVGNVFFDVSHSDVAIVAPPTTSVGGSVPATLSLTLGSAATFGAFTPGVTRNYDANATANVISTAGDATLSVADGAGTRAGHLVNGAFSLPQALQAKVGSAGFAAVSGTPLTVKTYDGPVSNDQVTIDFRQRIDANDALRTGAYSKTLTFTLSTTAP